MFFFIYTLSVHLLLQKDLIYQSQAKWIHNFPLLTQKEKKKKASSYWKLSIANSCFLATCTPCGGGTMEDYVLCVCVLVIHPMAKIRN